MLTEANGSSPPFATQSSGFPWPHLRHGHCHLQLPQHLASNKPIPHPIQRPDPILYRCTSIKCLSPYACEGRPLAARLPPGQRVRCEPHLALRAGRIDRYSGGFAGFAEGGIAGTGRSGRALATFGSTPPLTACRLRASWVRESPLSLRLHQFAASSPTESKKDERGQMPAPDPAQRWLTGGFPRRRALNPMSAHVLGTAGHL